MFVKNKEKEMRKGGMVLIGLLIFVLSIEAGELFKQAGQEALDRYEARLQEKEKEINAYIQEVSADGRVTGMDINKIRRKVREYDRIKDEGLAHLRIYELALEQDLCPEIRQLGKHYSYAVRRYDKRGHNRKLFASLTGKDLEIESFFMLSVIVFWAIMGFFCLVLSAGDERSYSVYYRLMGISFLTFLFLGLLGII